MKRVLSFFLLICFLFGALLFPSSKKESLPLRLRVVANSDLTEDQRIKYEVKEALLKELSTIDSSDRTTLLTYLLSHMSELRQIAEHTLAAHQVSQPVRVFFQKTNSYLTLQLSLGDARGHNWWGVLYPSFVLQRLCTSTDDELPLAEESKASPPKAVRYRSRILDFLHSKSLQFFSSQ